MTASARAPTKRRQWLGSGIWTAAAASAIAFAAVLTSWSEGRRGERVAALSRDAARRVLGTTPDVELLTASGRVFSSADPKTDFTLLYVTAPDCRPCERFAETVVGTLGEGPRGRGRLQVWVVGLNERDTKGVLDLLQVPLLSLMPSDADGFREAFAIEAIPYLAVLDAAGTVLRLQVGEWEGLEVSWLRDVWEPGR